MLQRPAAQRWVKEKGRSLLLFSFPSFMLLHCFYPLFLVLFVTMIPSPGIFFSSISKNIASSLPRGRNIWSDNPSFCSSAISLQNYKLATN